MRNRPPGGGDVMSKEEGRERVGKYTSRREHVRQRKSEGGSDQVASCTLLVYYFTNFIKY